MFDLLENAAELDLTGFDDCLGRTWDQFRFLLREKNIVFLTYRRIPLLFPDRLLASIGTYLNAEFGVISYDPTSPVAEQPVLFLMKISRDDRASSIWSSVTRHLIESKGRSKFIVVVSDEALEELKISSSYALVKPYCGCFDRVAEDPVALLSWLTRMSDPPAYAERRLPELLFIAAASKIEEEWVSQEEVSSLISDICLVETDGHRHCYFCWDRLPRLKGLLEAYLRSIGLRPELYSIARSDRDFYVGHFVAGSAGIGPIAELVEAVARVSADEAERIGRIVALRDRLKSCPETSKVLSLLYHVSLLYTISQGVGPSQRMAIDDREFAQPSALRKELHWVAGNVFPIADSVANNDWRNVGRVMQPHALDVAASRGIDFASTIRDVGSVMDEFLHRIEDYNDYDETQCKDLLIKAVQTVFLLECSTVLAHSALPDTIAQYFTKLWKACWQRISSPAVFGEAEWAYLHTKSSQLPRLNQRYRFVDEDLAARQVRAYIADKIGQQDEAPDTIEHFFGLFAEVLSSRDFLTDGHCRMQLGPDLAHAYLTMDAQLREGSPPFSKDFLDTMDLSLLIPSLPTTEFDRVFVLIIDGLSYLDWKLSRHEYSDLDCTIREEYRLSPVPTYTPCALTALVTGFHPSRTGIFDWKVRTVEGDMLDLKDAVDSEDMLGGSLAVQKTNSMTLVHSLVHTPLTSLQRKLADLKCLRLPSTEHQKAIAQAAELIYKERFDTRVVAIYIPDFDEFGHKWLRMNSFGTYYSVQASRIKNDLLRPIQRRALRESETTLAVLTADHGKLTRYESLILSTALPDTGGLRECLSLLHGYDFGHSSRHAVAWLPESDVPRLVEQLRSGSASKSDVLIYAGEELRRFIPHESETPYTNPNLLLMSRSGTGGHNMAHGGGAPSEIVVPAIQFIFNGG